MIDSMDSQNLSSQTPETAVKPLSTKSYSMHAIVGIGVVVLFVALVGAYFLEARRSITLPSEIPTEIVPSAQPTIIVTDSNRTVPDGLYLENIGNAPELTGITDWLNSSPVTIKGKSVLLVFCTPTLDNSFCSAVVPYLKQWDAKYKDKGLAVIWINTPYPVHPYIESTYRETSVSFMQKYSLTFPVGQDPTGTLSKQYNITSWPEFIFIDRHGIRYSARNVPPAGLAKYDNFEEAIIQLLAE